MGKLKDKLIDDMELFPDYDESIQDYLISMEEEKQEKKLKGRKVQRKQVSIVNGKLEVIKTND